MFGNYLDVSSSDTMNNKIITAAVAVLIIIAAVAAVLMMNNDDDRIEKNYEGRLQILGNANNDDYLDNDDVEALKKIISESGTVKQHPLADANNDGEIDDDDVEFVKRMINREKMDIFVMDGRSEVKSISYPVSSFISIGTDTLSSVFAVGGMEKVAAVAGKNLSDKVFYSAYQNTPKIGSSASNIKLEDTTSVTNANVIITTPHKSTFSNQPAFDAAGYTTIRLPLTDTMEIASGVLTLGYLIQEEDKSHKLAKFYDDTLDYIAKKTSDMSNNEKVKIICIMGSDSACGMQDTRYKASILAGANNILKENFGTKNIEGGSEWINNYNSAQKIFHITTSMTYMDSDLSALYKKLVTCVIQMDATIDGQYYLISGSIAPIVRVAYMATLLYPDIFGSDFGDEIHQEYIDDFLEGLHAGYKVTDGHFVYKQ